MDVSLIIGLETNITTYDPQRSQSYPDTLIVADMASSGWSPRNCSTSTTR